MLRVQKSRYRNRRFRSMRSPRQRVPTASASNFTQTLPRARRLHGYRNLSLRVTFYWPNTSLAVYGQEDANHPARVASAYAPADDERADGSFRSRPAWNADRVRTSRLDVEPPAGDRHRVAQEKIGFGAGRRARKQTAAVVRRRAVTILCKVHAPFGYAAGRRRHA